MRHLSGFVNTLPAPHLLCTVGRRIMSRIYLLPPLLSGPPLFQVGKIMKGYPVSFRHLEFVRSPQKYLGQNLCGLSRSWQRSRDLESRSVLKKTSEIVFNSLAPQAGNELGTRPRRRVLRTRLGSLLSDLGESNVNLAERTYIYRFSRQPNLLTKFTKSVEAWRL